MEIPYTIDKGKAYLSHTDGMWRVIWKGIPINADTPDRRRAEAMAKHYKLKLAEGIIWTENGWVQDIQGNPPMFAHHMRERKTHGLNLKQMRRLYAMVARGNQKAITFARNVLGIPFDETPRQVLAVVKHHVLDLGEHKVRKNPALGETLRFHKRKYKGFEIILEQQPGTILATWTDGDVLKSERYSGYSVGEVFDVVMSEIDDLKSGRKPGRLLGNRRYKGQARREREEWKHYQKYMGPGGFLHGRATREELAEWKEATISERDRIQDRVYARVQRESLERAKLRGNPSASILGKKKELVRVASEVAQNLISHFGPSMGYEKVANSEMLPRSVRIVMNAMTEPEGINYEKFSIYFPKSYNRREWTEYGTGNLATHFWWGQTDRGRNEVIRKGIEIAKRGKVHSNRRRRRK